MMWGKDSLEDMFIFETNDLIRQMEEIIMESENFGSFVRQDSIHAVFRIMHTIKSSALMMNLPGIAGLAHAMEDLFEYIRSHPACSADPRVMDIAMESLDFIKGEIDKLSAGLAADGDASSFVKNAQSLLNRFAGGGSAEEEYTRENTAADGQPLDIRFAAEVEYIAEVFFQKDSGMEALRAFMIVRDMQSMARDIRWQPEGIPDEDCEEDIRKNGFQICFRSDQSREEINQFLKKIEMVDQVSLTEKTGGEHSPPDQLEQPPMPKPEGMPKPERMQEPEQSPEPERLATPEAVPEQEWSPMPEQMQEPERMPEAEWMPEAASAGQTREKKALPAASYEEERERFPAPEKPQEDRAASAPAGGFGKETLTSVSVEKLDALMDLVGELVISGMMISQEMMAPLGIRQEDESERKELWAEQEEIWDKREALCRQHEKIIGDLRDIAAFLRMIPMSVTFHKMRLIIRDMCRKLDVRVNIQVIGEETEIDKNVLDGLSDPLMHLVRNAVSHGIESAGERLAQGKPEEGDIILEARNVGGDVWILVSDDGRGIDLAQVYQNAYENGWVTRQRQEMSDEELIPYIFKPGMTTSSKITEFSGRGVGLDVVSRNVAAIGGSVLVETVPKKGSTFILKVPTSLTIISGIAFSVAGSTYALPMSSIKECVEAEDQDLIRDSDGNEAIIIREECYPILRLHRLYNLKTEVTGIEEGILIVVDTDRAKYCLFVDRLVGEQQLVVKPLPKWIENRVKGVSGCTLLKDGSITLILEAARLTG